MERNINDHLGRLRKKLERTDSKNVDQFKKNAIVSNMQKSLNKESNYLTNQELIGLRNVFLGMVVKYWIGDDFNNNDDRKCNKAIMKESVLFYSEYWLDRCEALHDEDKQKDRLS